MTPPTEHPTHYLQWARRGKPGFFRYLAGALLFPSQSVAATIVKTTFFGLILSLLLIPLVPVLLNRRPWWSIAMPARKFEVTNLALGAGWAFRHSFSRRPIWATSPARRASSACFPTSSWD